MPAGGIPEPHAPRLNALTGLRWWAAFGVFIFHLRTFAPLPGMDSIARMGDFGVMFFFILSGFVLTWSAKPTTPVTTFYVNRFARIWPAAFVALLLAIPVFYSFDPDPAQGWVKPVDFAILALSIPLIQGWWRDPIIFFSGNPAAWTLTVEFFFYALHPILLRMSRLLSSRGALIAGLVVLGLSGMHRALASYQPGYPLGELPVPVMRLNEFVLGILVAQAMRRGWLTRLPTWVPFAAGALVVVVNVLADSALLPAGGSSVVATFTPVAFLAVFAVAIAAVASRELRGRPSFLARRPLVVLGEWSFAFYLVHATVMYVFVAAFGSFSASWLNLGWYVAVFVPALLLAASVHVWIERPFERRIRTGWANRRARASAPEAA